MPINDIDNKVDTGTKKTACELNETINNNKNNDNINASSRARNNNNTGRFSRIDNVCYFF